VDLGNEVIGWLISKLATLVEARTLENDVLLGESVCQIH